MLGFDRSLHRQLLVWVERLHVYRSTDECISICNRTQNEIRTGFSPDPIQPCHQPNKTLAFLRRETISDQTNETNEIAHSHLDGARAIAEMVKIWAVEGGLALVLHREGTRTGAKGTIGEMIGEGMIEETTGIGETVEEIVDETREI